jgi:hypothetical protein
VLNYEAVQRGEALSLIKRFLVHMLKTAMGKQVKEKENKRRGKEFGK